MTPRFKVIIPARYGATRLPGKPLLEIGGMTLIQHVYEAACRSAAARVIIATDDHRIENAARAFGAEVAMTSSAHASGTSRITEVADQIGEPDDGIVVNVQGDEFGLSPALIDQVAELLAGHAARPVATLCVPIIDAAEFRDPHAVKVVVDGTGRALYFSRASIPYQSGEEDRPLEAFRHVGIYAYRAGFLRILAALPRCVVERCEQLEQLRVLHAGYEIQVAAACVEPGVGVNSAADLERARALAPGE